jgi:4-aminobutyrate aminotransferase/(S)-3-amino-2-methylpropionate transaminase
VASFSEASQKGVIPLKCGLYGNVIRMLASLVITEEQLAEALDVMEEAIAEVEEEAGMRMGA